MSTCTKSADNTERTFVLTLTEDEAAAVLVLTGHCSSFTQSPFGKATGAIYNALYDKVPYTSRQKAKDSMNTSVASVITWK